MSEWFAFYMFSMFYKYFMCYYHQNNKYNLKVFEIVEIAADYIQVLFKVTREYMPSNLFSFIFVLWKAFTAL